MTRTRRSVEELGRVDIAEVAEDLAQQAVAHHRRIRHAAGQRHDIAVFPLAVPSIATPGAIMAAILLTDNHVYDIQTQVGTSLIMLAVLAVAFLFMLAAGPILKVIGQNGAAILIRVMGLILAAMSLEFILEAFHIFEWLETFESSKG